MSSILVSTGLFVGAGAVYLFYNYFKSDKGKKKNMESKLDPVPKDTVVVFVLGGPGAGKGTQCAKLVNDFGFVHLSAGDLLREERQREGSPFGELINTYIREGKIVPMEITISLLHKAMLASSANRFLIDGFPRQMDQALRFEEDVCQSQFVLFFDCPEEEMLKRLLKRGKDETIIYAQQFRLFRGSLIVILGHVSALLGETSGRVDDNIDSIKKRFHTFRETTFPVIEYYEKKGKVRKVDCMKPIDVVYEGTKKIFTELFSNSS